MIDAKNRIIDYLRISITDRCNLRCIYCMPEKGVQPLPHENILRYEELLRLCRIFAQLGVTRYKVTGGEPLVRKDVPLLVKELKKIPETKSVTLTTNGVLLQQQINQLAAAGLDGVNISLDTLDPKEFLRITRVGKLEDTLQGINSALKIPGLNVKINCVPTQDTLPQTVPLARLAKNQPLTVRFIELMPIGLGKNMRYLGEETVRIGLEKEFGRFTPCDQQLGNGPAHYFSVPGFAGKIGFISAISHQFCDQCNRVRLTADGQLKTCLQYAGGCDLRAMLRSGATDEKIRQAIQTEIENKPAQHHFLQTKEEINQEMLGMSSIGG